MRFLYVIMSVLSLNSLFAQQAFNGDYRSMGMSGGYMFNIDDAAIQTNPSLLGWQQDKYDHKMTISFADYWGASYSPIASFAVKDFFDRDINLLTVGDPDLSDTYQLNFVTWTEMLYSYDYPSNNYDTLVTKQRREDLKQSLMKNNSIKFSKQILGFTYVSQNVGTFSFKINKETNITTKLSETFADLWAYGKTSSYFDTLVMFDGTHIANTPNNYQNSTLDSIYSAFSNDTLKIHQIMDSSYFNLIQTRNYSIGWGNTYQSKNENIKLYVGAAFNLIEGLNYINISNHDDEIIVAKFGAYNLQSAKFGNAGLGASIGFSGTAIFEDEWMISTGVNNLGFINWKYKKGGYGVFSNENDNNKFANSNYGVSSSVSFQNQLTSSGFNWNSVNPDSVKSSILRSTPANYHLGVRFMPFESFSIGWNMVTPINKNIIGSLNYTLYAFNYEATFKKFTIFGGVNNMNKTLSMPFGFSIGSRKSKWEIGFSVADLYAFFNKKLDNNFSGGVGLKYRVK